MARGFAAGPARRHRERGQAIVEFSLTLPFYLIILLGLTELTAVFTSYIAVVNTSREGARLMARGNVFTTSQVTAVVTAHTKSLDLTATDCGVWVSDLGLDKYGALTFVQKKLVGQVAGSRFDQISIEELRNRAIGSSPPADGAYMDTEELVVVEVFYEHHFLVAGPLVKTLFQNDEKETVSLYAYTVMPVSGPS